MRSRFAWNVPVFVVLWSLVLGVGGGLLWMGCDGPVSPQDEAEELASELPTPKAPGDVSDTLKVVSGEGVEREVPVGAVADPPSDGSEEASLRFGEIVNGGGLEGSAEIASGGGAMVYTAPDSISAPSTDTVRYEVVYGSASNTGQIEFKLEENVAPTIETNAGLMGENSVGVGERVEIGTGLLSAMDPNADDTGTRLSFVVDPGPQQGILEVGGAEADRFTQADLEGGRVAYLHGGEQRTNQDGFSFLVRDATGAEAEGAPFDFEIEIDLANEPPVAKNDTDDTKQGEPTTTDILANDEDPDGDELDPTTVTIQEDPSDGEITSINAQTGAVTYEPNDGFTATDTYTYTVEDRRGAESGEATVTIEVVNNPSPEAAFEVDPANPQPGETVTFDASGSSDDGQIVSYDWDFGDGTTGSGEVAQHAYDTEGDYEVTLTVTDDGGKTGEASQTVQVSTDAPPTAAFEVDPTNPQPGEPVTFDADSSSDDGQIESYEWEFGDGTSGSGETTDHTYDEAGSYAVLLTVTDDAGQSDTETKVVEVGDDSPPQIQSATLTDQENSDGTVSSGDQVQVSAEVSDGGGSGIESVEADVSAFDAGGSDDTATLTDGNGDGTYEATFTVGVGPNDGDQSADVTATDGAGNSATETTGALTVNEPPTIDTNAGVAVTEGQSAAITTSDLSASDPDDSASDLTFEVTTAPTQGDLLVNGSSASSFTQQDIEQGNVEYDHTAGNADDDSFEFDLTDPSGEGPSGTFNITVNEGNQAPTASDDSDETTEGGRSRPTCWPTIRTRTAISSPRR